MEETYGILRHLLTFVVIWCAVLGVGAQQENQTISLNVEAGESGRQIPSTLFGIFFEKKFLKIWYKKKKITLQDISINKQVESKEVEAENVAGTDTSDEESVVEIIMEDKQQPQAPQQVPNTNQAPLGGELKKDTPLVKSSAYHHPHHPARKKPTRWKRISNKDNNQCTTDREV